MVLAIVGGGCGGGSADHGATPAPDVYSIAVTAGSAEALPRCSASLSGTVAYVVSPPMLLKCGGGHWRDVECATAIAGAVAYSVPVEVVALAPPNSLD
jgi:hypothetical protein